jgi:pyruvate, orthophosphate dikinase
VKVFQFSELSKGVSLSATLDDVGGKGLSLLQMSRLGVPVPPGFIVPVNACRDYLASGELPDAFDQSIKNGLRHIEEKTGRVFGGAERPLLVSVRSGASVSMPGMMDTVLNVGLLRSNLDGLSAVGRGRNFALDSYRRLQELHCEAASATDALRLSAIRTEVIDAAGVTSAGALEEEWLQGLTRAYDKELAELGRPLPEDPFIQLRESIINVFKSWNNRRARQYRRAHGISDSLGTAVTVQAMVFGNLDEQSGTGVAFTRDPNTGETGTVGEYLPMAQGEDVVSGRFTPQDLRSTEGGFKQRHPDLFLELKSIGGRLERHFRAVQDMEFTVESGKLWMLQTRDAKLSGIARIRSGVEMVHEGLRSVESSLLKADPEELSRGLYRSVADDENRRVIAKGLPASPGVSTGVACFSVESALNFAAHNEPYVLIRRETSIDDLDAARRAVGLLTTHGGMTSHAALVARGMGLACVTGCAGLVVEERKKRLVLRGGSRVILEGDLLTLDGTTGEVIEGRANPTEAMAPKAFDEFLSWADERRIVRVLANADTPSAATEALALGADGVGLCCTEHMFLDRNRPDLLHEMVLAYDKATRKKVLEHFAPFQKQVFRELLTACGSEPLSLRLLDLPLHMLTESDADRLDVRAIAARLGAPEAELLERIGQLTAHNPLLGHRGCRLGFAFPELYEVQARALFDVYLEGGYTCPLSLIVPMVVDPRELRWARKLIENVARGCSERVGGKPMPYRLGTMIETPRSCLVAAQLVLECDFFLVGLTDLTVSTYAMDRDDANRYLPRYLNQGIFKVDPFQQIDLEGVWQLVELATASARRQKPGFEIGVAGAQLNDPRLVGLCSSLDLNYVTSARHRVPVLRLAAGQQAILKRKAEHEDSEHLNPSPR